MVFTLLWLVQVGNQPATALPAAVPTAAPTAGPPLATPPGPLASPTVAAAVPTVTAVAASAAPATPTAELPPDALAIVNGVALTLADFTQLRTIDAIMAGLAGQATSAPGALVEQWVNGELVWQQATAAGFAGAEASAALAGLLARVGRTQDELDAALAAAQVAPAAFAAYWQRLITADQFAQTAAAAQGVTAGDYVRTLQQVARISFGPGATALFAPPETATPAATGPTPAVENVVAATPTLAAAALEVTPEVTPETVRGVETGMLAPEFVLSTVNIVSPTLALADLQGKPTVLSFWTTWCPYCLRQTPVMVEAYPRAAEAGIQFVGIDVQEDRNTVATYLAQHQIEYPILLDEQGSIAAQYAVQGYPTTYFLDSDGRIVARNVGALTREQLNTYLQMLGPPGPGP
jgi:peroxiredoxin